MSEGTRETLAQESQLVPQEDSNPDARITNAATSVLCNDPALEDMPTKASSAIPPGALPFVRREAAFGELGVCTRPVQAHGPDVHFVAGGHEPCPGEGGLS